MNLHRFLAYAVLACWIGLTAVVVGTAIRWSQARATTEVKIQRALNAQKEASASSVIDSERSTNADDEDARSLAEMRRTHDRLVVKAADANDDMSEAITFEAIERKQFWWEFAVWGGLTLLTSALLAESRESR